MKRTAGAVAAALLAALWAQRMAPFQECAVVLPSLPPRATDPGVATLGEKFDAQLLGVDGLSVSARGELKRDRDTTFWALLSDHFGSNPNTPYMFNVMPLWGLLFPSPIYHIRQQDAVVLLARVPPEVEYFSFTTFAAWMPRRKVPIPFSSLGDSVNSLNINRTDDGLFAHVVTGSQRTCDLLRQALINSGLSESAINIVPLPSDLGLWEYWTHFETVLRILRFKNQTDGNAYLGSHPPVFYIKANHVDTRPLPSHGYKSRANSKSAREAALEPDFAAHGAGMMSSVGQAFDRQMSPPRPLHFAPLHIVGLDCLRLGTECLGDCPDAAYFGPNIHEDSDDIEMLKLPTDDEFHVVTLVNHRALNAAVYGSIAILKSVSSSAATLSKTRMSVRATSIGITSFEWAGAGTFVSWAFTRNPEHCLQLMRAKAVKGCSVLEESQVTRLGYFTYCERIYLNPVTGTGPHHADVLPARLYHIKLGRVSASSVAKSAALFKRIKLPDIEPIATFHGSEPLRFLHIIKTGGESLEAHLAGQASPRLDFSTCRAAAMTATSQSNSSASGGCVAAAAAVSTALCGLNCECCASDVRLPAGGFHGTLLRSPRAHVLSQFSHCHDAHHGTWSRVASDVPLYFAELILRCTEKACGNTCATGNSDWRGALEELLAADAEAAGSNETVRVISLENTQSHALTCSKSHGSFGQHFKVLDGGDSLHPAVDVAVASMRRFEWVGLTDLFESSLCLLHFQANGSLPASCDCKSPGRIHQARLGHWVETRYQRRGLGMLSAETLAQIDAQTDVDAQVFAAALRLVLGRLRAVEEATGASLLECIDWDELSRSTSYIPGLWDGPNALLQSDGG